jgi:trehalose synthase
MTDIDASATTPTASTQHGPGRPLTRPEEPVSAPDAQVGPASADNPEYVAWLEQGSMLHSASSTALQLSGTGVMWQRSYSMPDPRGAVRAASVWYTAYPASLITAPGRSFIATLGDSDLWNAFASIGVQAVHTGPVKEAGGLDGWTRTESTDGYFDRISSRIDPMFGTDDEYRTLCAVATSNGGTVIDDLVPSHTGKGADFRLAELAYGEYPGAFHMVAIAPEDWQLLPEVPEGRDSANLDVVAERALAEAGYIVGPLQRVLFRAEGVKETNWAATRAIVGVDGIERRWVYLHYFKEGQPSINWLDPTFAGPRLVLGDALQSLTDLGSGGLRLDANGFLGVERRQGSTAWSEGHPLSEAGNAMIASMIRKVGGFSFQELNLSMDAILATSQRGPDLSYDFVTRPAYQHALLMGDTEFLELTLREAMAMGLDTGALVHALQNHDELTYELVHFTDTHAQDVYTFRGRNITGGELADTVRADLLATLTGDERPYNLPFTTNGISCTTATICAAAIGIHDLEAISDEDIERIRRAHLLLAAYNAFQPGVFAVSGWDLTGMLTVPVAAVEHLMGDGDTRWINRGAHDLMGLDMGAQSSTSGLPRGRALYGDLPSQLVDPDSFVSRLRGIVALRARHGIAEATLLEVPDADEAGVLVLVMRLPDGTVAMAAFNFGSEPIVEARVTSSYAVPGAPVVDLGTDEEVGEVDEAGRLRLVLGAHDARVVRIG